MLATTLLSRGYDRATSRTTHRATAAQNAGRDWLRHMASLPVDEAFDELGAHETGLSPDEVEAMRSFWGENLLSSGERPPLIKRFLLSFADPFTYILVFIAMVSVVTDWMFASGGTRDLTTPGIISVMVIVSAVLRFVQNERSGNAAEALSEMIETTCNVQRAETGRGEIPLDEVVVGDIIHLASGDIVPADLRVIAARDLFISQSSLTGESDTIEKRPDPVSANSLQEAVTDLSNLAFCGSTVISGSARGLVIATGKRTLLGEASANLGKTKRLTSSEEGIATTSRLLVGLMLVMVPTVLIICGVTKGEWLDALLFSLSVAIGLTPEMLPMLVTCCLGKGAVDLSHDKVIVKRLDAISDLGAIDVLCCDKTGTLTEDRVVLERHLDINGNDDVRVLQAAFLNSFFETGVRNLIDSAIIHHALDEDKTTEELADRFSLVDELPFDFERRRLSVVIGDEQGHTQMICKGAIEEILSICIDVEVDGKQIMLDKELANSVMERAVELADEGMRVLGVARKNEPAGAGKLTVNDEKDMTLIGYLAFLDPPKESASQAIAALSAHGVTTKVLTGDSARVACHVCDALDIPTNCVLTGTDIEEMDDEELRKQVREASVFAKLSPAQKVRVVEALRSLNHVVGFMGDGANDAAAMGSSDCGISVDSAVDVAREAADIILLEKDLLVLEHGIVCGRRTLANMIKYVKMTVSSNFGNIFSVLVASLLLPFLPMGAVQLLLLNLIYDLACTSLPWDNVDNEFVMHPRKWDSPSIRRFMFCFGPVSSILDIITFAVLFWIICPAVAGGAWATLSPASQATFIATFQAGWFIESMWTQTFAVQLIRTAHLPFIGSKPSALLTSLGLASIVVATLIPFTPVGALLDFAPLPAVYFAFLAGVIVVYVCALTVVKHIYINMSSGEFL